MKTLVKAIAKRQDVSPEEGKSKYGDVTYADPANKKYPIDSEAHVRAAWSYINQSKNAAKYSASDVATIKRKIRAAGKKYGIDFSDGDKTESALVLCEFSSHSFDGTTPNEIVYMPKGRWNITPLVSGQKKEITVEVDASAAARLQSDLAERLKKPVRPFGGFDHKPGPAAFHPNGFFWDENRGVILDVAWTKSGRNAIEGKDYGHFSPTFLLDGTNVAGLPKKGEIGSLTNNPAFEELSRIAASADENADMSKLANRLVELQVITAQDAEDADEDVLISAVNGLHDELLTVRAANGRLTAENAALSGKIEAVSKAEAQNIVQAAMAEGKIGAKDTISIDFWTQQLMAQPQAAKQALNALPANPALQKVITVKAGDMKTAATTLQDKAQRQAAQKAAIKKVQAAHPSLSYQDAFNEARSQEPEIFVEA